MTIQAITFWAIAKAGSHRDALKQLSAAKGVFPKGSDFTPVKKKDNYQDLLELYFHQFNIVLGLSHFKKTKKTPCNSDFPFEGTGFLNDSPVSAINSSILGQL